MFSAFARNSYINTGTIIFLIAFIGRTNAFWDLSAGYLYNFDSNVHFDNEIPSKTADLNIVGTAIVSPLWQRSAQDHLLHVQIQQKSEGNRVVSTEPFIVLFENGIPKEFYFIAGDGSHSRNFKRGFSLLLVTKALSFLPGYKEFCRQNSEPNSDLSRAFSCDIPDELSNAPTPLDILNNRISIHQKLSFNAQGALAANSITEQRSAHLTWMTNPIIKTVSKTNLKHWSTEKNLFARSQKPKREDTLAAFKGFKLDETSNDGLLVTDYVGGPSKLQLEKTIEKLRTHFTASAAASMNASSSFLLLQDAMLSAEKDELKNVIKQAMQIKKKKQSTTNYVLDAVAAFCGGRGLEAVKEVLQIDKKPENADLFMRYVTALSFASRIDSELINGLLELLDKNKDPKRLEAISLSLTSIGYSVRRSRTPSQTPELLEKIRQSITNQLEKCTGADVTICRVNFIRALGNLADLKSIPDLVDAIKSGGKVGVAATKSLRRFQWNKVPEVYYQEVSNCLWDVYEDATKKYDSSCKLAAFEWLRRQVPRACILRLLNGIPSIKDEEARTYILSTLLNMAPGSNKFREAFGDSKLNYANMATKGLSLAYAGMLTSQPQVNATYGLSVEVAGGAMRSSEFSVDLQSNETELSVVRFGMYTHGLSALLGASDETSGEDEAATAGLELEIFDVSVPRLVFFNGMSELMSLAWKAGGDDPVAAMQYNLALQSRTIQWSLANGITFETVVRGATSIDSAGYVEFSIWSRTSKSLVRNRAAVTFESRTMLLFEKKEPKLVSSSSLSTQGRMDFQTNIDFSSLTPKFCMQMTHSPLKYRRTSEFSFAANQAAVRRKNTIPPRSFSFGRENAHHCATVL